MRIIYIAIFLFFSLFSFSQSIVGPVTSCLGEQEQYSVQGVPLGTTYSWSAVGGSIQGSSTEPTVTIQWNMSGTRRVDVTATTPSGGLSRGGFGGSGGGSGGEIYNLSQTVSVSAATNAGLLSTSISSACSPSSVTLNVSGKTGTIESWQYRDKYGSGNWGFWTEFSTSTSSSRSYSLSTNSATSRTFQFRVRVQNSTCSEEYAYSSNVIVYGLPTAYSVTGGGSYCSGGSGKSIGLSDSQSDINYQLKRNGSNVGSAKSGTGSAISFGNQTSAGTYTVVATNTSTGCTKIMSGSKAIVVNSLPTVYSVTGGGSYCSGGSGVSIGLSDSQSGVNYQLKRNGSNVGSVKSGTGSAISFGDQTSAGTYTVVATNESTGCTKTMSGSKTVTISSLPASFSLTGGGRYCSGGSGVSLGLSDSQSGVDYQLKLDGNNIGSVKSGTGNAISFGNQVFAGTYTVMATNASTGCVKIMPGSKIVTVDSLPTEYTVTEGGIYCSGGNGRSVELSDSQSGINYQLKLDGSSVGSPMSGTGSSLDFGSQTATGSYTVVAINTSTNCSRIMTGSATITIDPLPAVYNVLGSGAYCFGESGREIKLSDSELNVFYDLIRNGLTVQTITGTGSAISFGLHTSGDYTISAIKAHCNTTMNGVASISETPNLMQGSISYNGGVVNFGDIPTTINGTAASGGDGVYSYQWEWKQGTATQFTPVSGEVSEDLNPTILTETASYRRAVSSCNQLEVTNSETVNVIYPSILSSNGTSLTLGESTTLSLPSVNGNTFQWFKNEHEIVSETGSSLTVYHPGIYHALVTASNNDSFTTASITITDEAVTQNENYIKVRTFKVPTFNASGIVDVGDVADQFTYYDALGRSMQAVQVNASPGLQDVIVPMEYDEYGRQYKSYLPYVDGQGGLLKSNALNPIYQSSDHYNYYKHISSHNTEKAFSESSLEASPLGRVLKQGSPGEAWEVSGAHAVTFEYASNNSTEVIYFTTENLLNANKQHYLSDELHKSIITDEDGNQTIEFANRQGQTVLKKSQVDGIIWAETYYIYDIYGNLSVVIPPEATSRLDAAFYAVGADRFAFLNTWAFIYNYDHRNRMIMKKVPGADSVFMVYDQWDRLVLTQDGNQRTGNQWIFTKYDQLNRPIMTGLMTGGSVTSERAAVEAISVRHETFDSTKPEEYTNVSYPTTGIDEYFTVTYYDSYNWDNTELSFTNPSGLTLNGNVKGQVTGTLIKVEGGDWIKSVSYYDDKYRVIQTQSTNHLGGKDVVTNYYDFIGQLEMSISTHGDGVSTTIITRNFEYDHAGRLMKTWHQLNNEDPVLIAENQYNDLGELAEKDLHEGEQSLDYSYNIRGWLTKINDASLSDPNDLFGMELYYNESSGLSSQIDRFNGNIAAMKWSNYDVSAEHVNDRGYTFGYDKLNRLTGADHYENGTSTNKFGVSGLNYDLNGNILDLKRRSTSVSDYMDNLDYNYSGNQLKYVNDVSGDSLGFDNNATGLSIDYTYDANGNMIADGNKGITAIEYNHLNLPLKVEFGSADDRIEYLYNAAGIKLKQTVYEGAILVKTTDYVGEFIYETIENGNRKIALIQHDEGRIIYKPFEDVWDYQYHLKDHLGNVRMTFSTAPDIYERTATMEFSEEQEAFDPWAQSPRNGLFTVGNTSANVMRLNTDAQGDSTLVEGIIGLSAMYQVQKGDRFDLSVKAYYEHGPSSDGFFGDDLLFNMIVSGSTGSSTASENSITNNSNLDVTVVGGLQASKDNIVDTSVPRAYLNWMIFDKDTVLVNAGFGQISSSANNNWETLVTDESIEIEQDGFFFTYVSNETNALSIVDFDDFKVTLTKTNVVSTQDYYPFGLTFNESVRVASTVNRFKYNSFEYMDDLNLNLYDYQARYYDPAIGRFIQVDPAADLMRRHSVYNYAFDNPIRFVDPDGMVPSDSKGGSESISSSTSTPFDDPFFNGGNDPRGSGGGYTLDVGSRTEQVESKPNFNFKPVDRIGHRNGGGDKDPKTHPNTILRPIIESVKKFFSGIFSGDPKQQKTAMNNLASATPGMQGIKLMYLQSQGYADYSFKNAALIMKDQITMASFAALYPSVGNITSVGINKIGNIKVPVYRVYGGEASMYGKSYSIFNPRYVPSYRNFAGLPNSNTGQFLLKGYIPLRNLRIGRPFAQPLNGNTGGLPLELYQNFDQLRAPANILINKKF